MRKVVLDIADVSCTRNCSVNVAVVFPCLFASIQLLVTVEDTCLNCEATAVCPPNPTCPLPKNADQKRFIFRQRHAVAELRQVNSRRLLVWCSQLIRGQMALQNRLV
jgi:hypothetical protein